MQHVLCTGNLTTRDQYDMLRDLAPNVHVTRGDFDEPGVGGDEMGGGSGFPEKKVVRIGDYRIGLLHGHTVIPWGDPDSLLATARSMDVDILITGHTHSTEVRQYEGKWFVNPGSITGAFSPVGSAMGGDKASFILLAIQGRKVVCYCYVLGKGGEVEVSKTEFEKGSTD